MNNGDNRVESMQKEQRKKGSEKQNHGAPCISKIIFLSSSFSSLLHRPWCGRELLLQSIEGSSFTRPSLVAVFSSVVERLVRYSLLKLLSFRLPFRPLIDENSLKMEIFTFLFIYFLVSSSLALIVYAAFLLLQRYADLIPRSDQSKVVVLALLLATSLTFQWYAISSTLVMFNKWFMTRWRAGGFGFPLLTTCIHMLVKLCVTRIWLCFSSSTEPTPTDDWCTYLTLVVPIGVCTVVDIALSNQALIYIPVALYTTIKSSSLVFVFLFGVALGLETFRWPTFLCVMALAR